MRERLFWKAGVFSTAIEIALIALVLSLPLIYLGIEPEGQSNSVLWQGFIAVAGCTGLWGGLRQRVTRGRFLSVLITETLLAGGFSLVVGGSAILLLYAFSRLNPAFQPTVYKMTFGGIAGVLVFGSGVAFLCTHLGGRFYLLFDRQRRRKLVWSLTHAHLTVVMIAGGLGILAMLIFQLLSLITGTGSDPSRGILHKLISDFLTRFVPFIGLLMAFGVIGVISVLPPAAAVSYFVARRTTRRIESLAKMTAALRAGNLQTRIDVSGEDEIAQLQTDFNAMAAEMQQNVHELQAERDRVAKLLQGQKDLVAAISHELRTPVATMRSYLESDLARADGDLPDDLRRDLEVIERERCRLEALIEDLFTLARAQTNGLNMRLERLDVGELVRHAAEALGQPAWQSGRVEVTLNLPASLPPVCADAARVTQILVNLISNAVRHTPPGGIVAVSAASVPGHVELSVSDTGDGIAPEALPRVWERFFQAAGTQGGAGLGLAIVKELAEAMGGSVCAESTPGQGSTFRVRLPVDRK